ncbi:MAG: NAD(P)H-dependent oxidoreductase [Nitritalea sp.]
MKLDQLLADLNWRYATKRMNGNAVPEEQVEQLLTSIQLTATSNGLQPFTVYVIQDEALRRQLHEVAYQQPQILEGSHLLVFAAWKEVSPERIEAYFQDVYAQRNMEDGALAQYENHLKKTFGGMTTEEQFHWSAKQAYIALGTALVAAAQLRIDSTPMEGFQAAEVDRVLGLSEKGLGSAALLALGYRNEAEDHLADAPKVRRAKEQLFIRL